MKKQLLMIMAAALFAGGSAIAQDKTKTKEVAQDKRFNRKRRHDKIDDDGFSGRRRDPCSARRQSWS